MTLCRIYLKELVTLRFVNFTSLIRRFRKTLESVVLLLFNYFYGVQHTMKFVTLSHVLQLFLIL